jgi:hypothetical protein
MLQSHHCRVLKREVPNQIISVQTAKSLANGQIYINININQNLQHLKFTFPPTCQYKKYTVMPCAQGDGQFGTLTFQTFSQNKYKTAENISFHFRSYCEENIRIK